MNSLLAKLTSYNAISQYAHFLAGAMVVIQVEIFYGFGSDRPAIYATLLVIALAAVKEFWFDQNYEDAITRGSNLEDWLFWSCGAVAALLEVEWSDIWYWFHLTQHMRGK